MPPDNLICNTNGQGYEKSSSIKLTKNSEKENEFIPTFDSDRVDGRKSMVPISHQLEQSFERSNLSNDVINSQNL